jgi:hypothetical protein
MNIWQWHPEKIVNRADAYKILASRLQEIRDEGYAALVQRVGRPVTSQTVRVNNEDVVVEIAVLWEDQKRRSLRVRATAYGPSMWMTQRLEESFVVALESPNHC